MKEITITNYKTASYRSVDLNKLFDPGNKHEREFAFENCGIASPRTGNKTYVTFYCVPPGKSNYPYHYHMGMEEVFYIISGTGVLDCPKGQITVSEGDAIVVPSGEGGAHRLTNTSTDEPLRYFEVDTCVDPEVVFYPRTQKLRVMTGQFAKSYPIDANVNYLLGE